MKWLVVVAVIAGCLASLDAVRLLRRDSSGENAGGVGLNGFFATNVGSNGVDGALEAAGETVGGFGGGGNADDGGNDANDGGGDTPDGRDNSPGAAAAAGGFGNEVGDTPDGVDSPDVDSPDGGRQILKNNGQTRGVDDQGERSADPGQMVGASSSVGTTAGIVVGVVALVGVAAGVAVYVIKKRN